MIESEVQKSYLDVPVLSVISDLGMRCVQFAPELPE